MYRPIKYSDPFEECMQMLQFLGFTDVTEVK